MGSGVEIRSDTCSSNADHLSCWVYIPISASQIVSSDFPTVVRSDNSYMRNTGGSLVIDGRSALEPEPPEFRITVNLVRFGTFVGYNGVVRVDPFKNASVDIDHIGISLLP